MGVVKGLLTITSYMVVFDGVECTENVINELCTDEPNKIHAAIDLRDITDLRKVKLGNDLPYYFDHLALRIGYSHDYFLNILVSAVKGEPVHLLS